MAPVEDDGTSQWAAEEAAGMIGRAWYRANQEPGTDAGELMLGLAQAARSHITKEQWAALAGE